MEVVCSLEDVARVLADNGYNLNDDSCFANATDLPSVLSALDSPESNFPESPCSDEDIARVLDIARMPSPSLLDSCTPSTHLSPFTSHNLNHHPNHNHHHHHHLPSPTESHDTFHIPIQKTRDPCITNAVLQNSLLPSFNNHHNHHSHHNHTTTTREPNSLDLFNIAMNCSFQDESVVPNFNSLVTAKDINNNITNDDAFNNYFNSSSALSPVSETDVILQTPPEPSLSSIQTSHQITLTHHQPSTLIENTPIPQPSSIHPTTPPTIDIDSTISTIDVPSPTNPLQVNMTQTKRKRRKKSSLMTPKPKRRKQQDKSQANPKPKPKPKQKQNKTKNNVSESIQSHETPTTNEVNVTNTKTISKRKNANKSNSGPMKSKKSKINNSSTLDATQECDSEIATTSSNDATTTPGNTLSTVNSDPATTEIGSTNGVNEECKGLRRSSRATKNPENYNFRLSSLVKRVQTERKQKEPKQPKGKAKPPPLSKYRRRTANARERDRMKEINDAYDVLKDALPEMEPDDGKNKITKFTILKLALNYIASLQDILGIDPERPNPSAIDIADFSALELQSRSSDAGSSGQSCSNDTTPMEEIESQNDVSDLTSYININNNGDDDDDDNDDVGDNSDECKDVI